MREPTIEAEPKIIELDDTDWERSLSWLPNTILIQTKPLSIKVGLKDKLLVSAMGPLYGRPLVLSDTGPVYGGLLAINGGVTPSVRVMDRLPSSGISIDHRAFVRSVLHQHMVLHFHTPEGVRIITNTDCQCVHDVRLQFGQLYVVSTGTNEVVQVALSGRILNRWKFPGDGDTRHLNCLDLWNGRYVVSCFGRFEKAGQFEDHGKGAGIVFDLETDETIWDGLHYPHTPRMDNGRQFICDSGSSRLLIRDCDGSNLREIHFPQSFTRGIAFGKDHIYVGLSCLRGFKGEAMPSIPNAKIARLDRFTFELLDELDLPCWEVYDVVALDADDTDAA